VIGVVDEVAAGRDLDPVAAGLEAVEEEALGDAVLRRAASIGTSLSTKRSAARRHSSRVSTQKARWCSRPRAP
jgi:hypothetical protein